MYRLHKRSPNLSKTTAEWPGTTWQVTLEVNNRMSVVDMTVTARRLVGPDAEAYGTASCAVQPFDDLGAKMLACMIDSAVDSVEDLCDQLELDLGPEPFPL